MSRTALYTRLSSYTALTSLVSTRIYPLRVPQNAAMPAVSYNLIAETPNSAMGTDTGVVFSLYQVDCWADTVASVQSVAAQVKAALQRYSGTENSVVVQDIYLVNQQDLYETQTETYRVSFDFRMAWEG